MIRTSHLQECFFPETFPVGVKSTPGRVTFSVLNADGSRSHSASIMTSEFNEWRNHVQSQLGRKLGQYSPDIRYQLATSELLQLIEDKEPFGADLDAVMRTLFVAAIETQSTPDTASTFWSRVDLIIEDCDGAHLVAHECRLGATSIFTWLIGMPGKREQ